MLNTILSISYIVFLFSALAFTAYHGYLLLENFKTTRKTIWLIKHTAGFILFSFVNFLFIYIQTTSIQRHIEIFYKVSIIAYIFSFAYIWVGWLVIVWYKEGYNGLSERLFGISLNDFHKYGSRHFKK